tara:strand:+ start:639 stop:1430 length:792 start_codon:yes stop_codon:yes gene_type:complete
MTVRRFEAFDDNYIWGIEEKSNFLIVDPGDPEPIIEFLRENKTLKLAGILITHHHFDHVGGINKLTNLNDLSIYCNDNISFCDDRKCNSLPIIGPFGFEKYGVNNFVKEKDSFFFGKQRFTVIEIPGHTNDHIGFLCEHNDLNKNISLFCGDTLFAAGCGRILGGKAEDLYASLNKISVLPEKAMIYCAHEYTLDNIMFAESQFPDDERIKRRKENIVNLRHSGIPTVPSKLLEEKITNPFLRCKNIEEFIKMRNAKDKWKPK